ncbi:tigger transposable element-derived protein 6-like [Dermacentor silvarum]|uniref:tigger transposable element-derived protein 6-like n=1 Tax=Dermacentor silvarum TaxID=543639 RepID=UPI001899571C|nr:tigger transposable element-derived protein 6-like [Dermacentor silvarum]
MAKEGAHEKLEKVLVKWLLQARSSAINIDGAILKEKADLVALRLGIDGFKASNGWLDRFKKRNNIVYSRSCGESSTVDVSTVQEWKETLPDLIAAYKPCDVFNADESGIFYNMQPEQTLTFKGDSCHGGKRSKERLTALFCANEDGSEKLPVLVIGKFGKPRCFKNIRTLPCSYDFNKKAWMTSSIFTNFLQRLDNKMGAKARKILFMDNAPCHPPDTTSLRNVKVVFLPPNCTSCLQPLDAGIIKCVKQGYRKQLVQRRLAAMERSEEEKISVLDAMHMIANGTAEAVVDDAFAECDELDMAMNTVGANRIAYSDYCSVDDAFVTSAVLSVDDVVAECADACTSDDEVERNAGANALIGSSGTGFIEELSAVAAAVMPFYCGYLRASSGILEELNLNLSLPSTRWMTERDRHRVAESIRKRASTESVQQALKKHHYIAKQPSDYIPGGY